MPKLREPDTDYILKKAIVNYRRPECIHLNKMIQRKPCVIVCEYQKVTRKGEKYLDN